MWLRIQVLIDLALYCWNTCSRRFEKPSGLTVKSEGVNSQIAKPLMLGFFERNLNWTKAVTFSEFKLSRPIW